MRNGINENINLDGKLHEIIKYNTSNLSAYKLAGFFRELFMKAKATQREIIVRKNHDEIVEVSSYEVYFSPEETYENSAKQRDDYYGKVRVVVIGEDKKEYEFIAYDDCYSKEENINNVKIETVKIIVSDAVVIEAKTI